MTEDLRSPSMESYQQPFVEDIDESVEIGAPRSSRNESAHVPRTPPAAEAFAPESSATSGDQPAAPRSRPISEAVTHAFQDSPATHQIDPQLISVITAQVAEQVAKHLAQQQAGLVSPTVPSYPGQYDYPPPPETPDLDPTAFGGQVLTPPTPDAYAANDDDRGYMSPSPDLAPSDTASRISKQSWESLRSGVSARSDARPDVKPQPVKTDSSSTIRQRSPSTRRPSAHERTISEAAPARRDSKTSTAGLDGASRPRPRPTQEPLDEGDTPLERTWQPLFKQGQPTPRLSQFLRGVALHLIYAYEPQRSLVVTPAKMLRFFRETRVDDEHYPWPSMFGGKMPDSSISVMYRKLMCEHHFVQSTRHDSPSVPGLTPHGFTDFMICLIQAHPEIEFDRLAKAVMNMPISNADNKKERFPKELPRRLLPSHGNIQAEQRLISSLNHEQEVLKEVSGAANMPPPPPPAAPTSAQPAKAPPVQRPPQQSFVERERQQYAQGPPPSSAIADEDLRSPSLPIERERQPYSAGEGTGRSFANDERRQPPPTDRRPEQSTRHRSNSGVPNQGIYPPPSGQSQPINIAQPPAGLPHRISYGQGNGPPSTTNGGLPKSVQRRSSPPPRNPAARSGELFDSGSIPNQPFGSQLQHAQSSPTTWEAPDQRFQSRPSRSERPPLPIPGNEDTSGVRNFNRTNSNVNAYEYGSMGGPVGGPPNLSSSYTNRPPIGSDRDSASDSRRRQSMYASSGGYYGGGGGDGGTDGYGSYSNGGYPPQPPYGSSTQH